MAAIAARARDGSRPESFVVVIVIALAGGEESRVTLVTLVTQFCPLPIFFFRIILTPYLRRDFFRKVAEGSK